MATVKYMALLISHALTPEQVDEAKRVWGVAAFLPLPSALQERWSQVPPDGPFPVAHVQPIVEWLEQETREGDLVFVQGEAGAVVWVVQWCWRANRIPVYATTVRQVEEQRHPDGSVATRRVFRHVLFRLYPRWEEAAKST